MTNFDMVEEFHYAFNLPIQHEITGIDEELRDLRIRLIEEEVTEVKEAMEAGRVYDVAKELADVLYVVYGTALVYGIDLDWAFQKVHESNMSKLGPDGKPIYREDGKVLKGPNYAPPDMSSFAS